MGVGIESQLRNPDIFSSVHLKQTNQKNNEEDCRMPIYKSFQIVT